MASGMIAVDPKPFTYSKLCSQNPELGLCSDSKILNTAPQTLKTKSSTFTLKYPNLD